MKEKLLHAYGWYLSRYGYWVNGDDHREYLSIEEVTRMSEYQLKCYLEQ